MAKQVKIDLSRIIENLDKKQTATKKETQEETNPIVAEFSSVNEFSSPSRLDTTLKEDKTKKQELEETAKEAPKKEEKEETKKVYEGVYNSDNSIYKNQKREPEVRVNSRFVNQIQASAINFSQPTSSNPRAIGMVREDRFIDNSHRNDSNEGKYDLSRRSDQTNVNPFNPEIEMKERKYQI